MSFRDNLQHLRATRNMTQEQLAMLLGVSRQSVTKWEAEKSYPEMDKLIKICQIFECSLDDLVTGDLTGRVPAPTAAAVPSGPATDICGYDMKMRSFAKRVPTGIAAFVLGVVGLIMFEEGVGIGGVFQGGMTASYGELIGLGCLFAGVLAGVGILVSYGLDLAAFQKAHPYIEDFYTEEERQEGRRLLVRGLLFGIGAILAGVWLAAFIEHQAGSTGMESVALLVLVAAGVWYIVYAVLMFDRLNIADYNKSAAEELEVEDIERADVSDDVRQELLAAKREQSKIGAVCGVIMLIATIIALTWLFLGPSLVGTTWDAIGGGHQAADSPVSYFWLPWVIGGILCGIVSILMKAFGRDR